MTNEAVTGADQLLAFIKDKDARIKEIEALRQHIFDYSKTRKIYLEYKRLPNAKKAEFYAKAELGAGIDGVAEIDVGAQGTIISLGAETTFKGTIYCVRVYNRALTEEELKENFKVDQQRYGIK